MSSDRNPSLEDLRSSPTRPEEVVVRPQRTPLEIARSCVAPLAALAIAATKGAIGPAEIAAASAQVRDAVQATIQRERDERLATDTGRQADSRTRGAADE